MSLKEADEEFITFHYLAQDIDRNSSDFYCRGSSLTVWRVSVKNLHWTT